LLDSLLQEILSIYWKKAQRLINSNRMECVPEVSEKNVDKHQEDDEREENQHPVQKAVLFSVF